MWKKVYFVFGLFCVLVAWGACTKDQNKEGLPCEQDHQCLSEEKCHKGHCTPKDQVPAEEKEEKDAGEASPPDQPAEKAPEMGPEKKPEGRPEKAEEKRPEKVVDKAKPTYPPGPYGADVDDVVMPIDLDDCGGKRFHLSELYKHPQIKIVLISVHAGWCGPCMSQAKGLEAFYQKYKDKGFLIWNILIEDTRRGGGQVPQSYCESHVRKYGFTFPLLKDPGAKVMGKIFDRNATPLNMIISTKEMKIVYKKAGSLPSRLEGIVASYLEM